VARSLEQLATLGLRRLDAEGLSAFVVSDGDLRGEHDAVCPRCFRWIGDQEFVRRTAYGPLQHEVCPEAS
jgi:hypothetical protein